MPELMCSEVEAQNPDALTFTCNRPLVADSQPYHVRQWDGNGFPELSS